MSTKSGRPVVLISMDGVGVAPPGPGNAVTLANTPNLDKYWPLYPHTFLEAAGINVGLPTGVDGNSEVGHTTMGAGKILFQDLPRIDNAIKNGSFMQNPEFKAAADHIKGTRGKLHILGLIGAGKVHSSLDHMFKVLEFARQEAIDPDSVFIHLITDGRDSEPNVAMDYIRQVMDRCVNLRIGRVASVMGRFYAMDRDRRWDRTQAAYEMLTQGKGSVTADIEFVINEAYKQKKTDEYIDPTQIVVRKGDPVVTVQNGDALIFTNFRADRAIQLTKAFTEEEFTGFKRDFQDNLYFVGMTKYADDFPKHIAFPPEKAENFLGKVLADNKLKQLRVAESEKFAHVTYFFNTGYREVLPGETWLEVPSPKEVVTYDQKPEMSMLWVTDIVVEKVDRGEFDFILVNLAGPDMVGHTGNIQATVESMQVCDECIGRIVDKTLEKGGAVILTADHGNAEEMLDLRTGEADTKHSVNQVPAIIIQEGLVAREVPIGNLGDLAPTVLALLGIEKPAEMTGRNLLA
jgi:2,3-bisphosphoglycerate-independent phosphoglycerate mutase